MSNFHHSIEVSLKTSTNKLQERILSDFYQITRPCPKSKFIFCKKMFQSQKATSLYNAIISHIRYNDFSDLSWCFSILSIEFSSK
jgi:hypothetical protein